MQPSIPSTTARIGLLRLVAIFFIYCGAVLAWLILGGTIENRTHSSESGLHDRVGSTWGTAQEQAPHLDDPQYRVAPDELLLPGGGVLLIPLVAGISGRPH